MFLPSDASQPSITAPAPSLLAATFSAILVYKKIKEKAATEVNLGSSCPQSSGQKRWQSRARESISPMGTWPNLREPQLSYICPLHCSSGETIACSWLGPRCAPVRRRLGSFRRTCQIGACQQVICKERRV